MKNFYSNQVRRLLLAALFLVGFLPMASAQGPAKVSGTVHDDQRNPMVGVNVIEKGTVNGTITDTDGKYVLTVAPGATLEFSHLGYIPQQIAVEGDVVDAVLYEDAQTMDEVVVVGYGVQKKSSVTGAISQVKAEDMQNRTITNAQAALQGKTAGVQVIQASSAPGASPTVRVRGFSSNVSSNPLYVVDGIRLSDISGIDPNDIASMEVLKDAASAAIYGAEAGNG
ncbi:MAG: TonB-dependent receptor plug domain-containing protein, partial [Alistipes sp.]|nr:TonB-dependent receptor plug domain-containing protein [Alistipes sp.]